METCKTHKKENSVKEKKRGRGIKGATVLGAFIKNKKKQFHSNFIWCLLKDLQWDSIWVIDFISIQSISLTSFSFFFPGSHFAEGEIELPL